MTKADVRKGPKQSKLSAWQSLQEIPSTETVSNTEELVFTSSEVVENEEVPEEVEDVPVKLKPIKKNKGNGTND